MSVATRKPLQACLVSLCLLLGVLAFASPAAQAEFENPYISQLTGLPRVCGVYVDPASQDVYVAEAGGNPRVEVYNAQGVYQSQITGKETPAGHFGTPRSVAVSDKTGDVYVADDYLDSVFVFSSHGVYLEAIEGFTAGAEAVAVDQASGDVYVLEANTGLISRFNSKDESEPVAALHVEHADGLATDAHGDLYVSQHSSPHEAGETGGVYEFNAAGSQLAHLTPPAAQSGFKNAVQGVAVDSAGNVYLANEEYSTAYHALPSVLSVDEFTTAGALLGEIKGAGPPTGPPLTLQDGVAVNAAGDLYVGDANDELGSVNHGVVDIFGPRVDVPTPPSIDEESVGEVTATAATVVAQVNPNEEATTAYVEYGPGLVYDSSTAAMAVHLGSGFFDAPANQPLTDLTPSTTYHYRVVAVNASHETTYGQDKTFTTYPLSSGHFTLPDDRAYELVSPVEKNGGRGGVYPYGFTSFLGSSGGQLSESSPEGNAVAYVGEPFYESQNGYHSNQYVSVRTAEGWKTKNVTPVSDPGSELGVIVGFSSNLMADVVQDRAPQGAVPIGPDGPSEYEDLWLRGAGGGYDPLVDTQAFALSTRHRGEKSNTLSVEAREPNFAGASTNFTHLIFEAHDTLTPEAQEFGGEAEEVTNGNLYEWFEGKLSLINVLPGNGGTAPAGFGSGTPTPNPSGIGVSVEYHRRNIPNLSNVISSDGSRVFWTDTENGDLYVREGAGTLGARTVLISEGGQYWTANAEGSLVFFTKAGHLYQFDTETQTTSDSTPEGTVEGVVGTSEDGSYVYVVASGRLGPAPGDAVAGQPNLYLLHAGETRYVTTLAQSDGEQSWFESFKFKLGDWASAFALRTARVSPNGQYVAFLSSKGLTGYENRGAYELYRYGAEANELVCVSCQPSGAPPTAGGVISNTQYSMFANPAINGIYQQRYLANDGRVFFETNEALLPQDTNKTTDVYEYEEGHVYLISSGTGGPSQFADASENGENVFFTTVNQLVPQDQDQNVDIYDARVRGGSAASVSTECTGTGCQGLPPVPPIFATPASVTFTGVGNVPAPAPVKPAVKAKTKPAKCKKGDVRKKGRCVKRKAKKKSKAKQAVARRAGGERGARS